MSYYLMKLLSKIFCLLPYSVAMKLGDGIGALAHLFVQEWRMKTAAANIEECLGTDKAEARIIAKKSLTKFGRMIAELLRFPLLTKDNITDIVEIDGLSYLEEAYAEGKGVILCSAHFGNWELAAATISLLGYKSLNIARKQNNGDMDHFINEYRAMVGEEIAYHKGKSGLLAMRHALKAKKGMGIMFDQDTGDAGIELKLFGKDSGIPGGPAVFSRMTGAVMLPLFMHYDAEKKKNILKVYPGFKTEKTANKEKDLLEATRKLVDLLEQEVHLHPCMWFWVHDRWKDGKKRFKKRK